MQIQVSRLPPIQDRPDDVRSQPRHAYDEKGGLTAGPGQGQGQGHARPEGGFFHVKIDKVRDRRYRDPHHSCRDLVGCHTRQ